MSSPRKSKRVIIIGAGPGGLSAGMILAHQGCDVRIYEKADQPGGRTSELRLGDYRFDVGPTFLMMPFVLEEIFASTGREVSNYLDLIRLSPMYRLQYEHDFMDIYDDSKKMTAEINRVFPGEKDGLERFMRSEAIRYEKLLPVLLADNNNPLDIFKKRFVKAFPHFSLGKSVYDILGNYFNNRDLRISFTFQAKYLGMSPWQCPAAFGIVPYVEHAMGVFHVRGGISEISRQMARVIEEENGSIYYNTSVKQIILRDKKAIGVELENGEKILGDDIILNADFGYAANKLFPPGTLKKYAPQKLVKKELSCSIFMMYLGVKKQYKLRHNTIVLAHDYRKNVEDVFGGRLTEGDISFYVRDHSSTDPTLAPEGKTALYVLVPVPNLRAGLDWQKNRQMVRGFVIDGLKKRLGLSDIEEHIEAEKIHTPEDWSFSYNVYEGAVFNLSHKLSQMLWLRPHNAFEEVQNTYLTGGGTHPGSGLPTIWHSGRIVADLIMARRSP